jgi:hypothetical protein
MIWFVVKGLKFKTATHRYRPHGWGNGYVAVPPSHPLWGIDYGNVDQHLDVHGGLTYSELKIPYMTGKGFPDIPSNYWVFGFDTSHWDDTLKTWPKKAVEAEAKRLFCQLMDIEIGGL